MNKTIKAFGGNSFLTFVKVKGRYFKDRRVSLFSKEQSDMTETPEHGVRRQQCIMGNLNRLLQVILTFCHQMERLLLQCASNQILCSLGYHGNHTHTTASVTS